MKPESKIRKFKLKDKKFSPKKKLNKKGNKSKWSYYEK